MSFTTDTLSLYHTFSKTPVDSNNNSAAAQLGNAINKSGHTVQSNEVWSDEIPFFGLAATTTAAHSKFSATARTNDLVMVSGVIYQRNANAYTSGATFATLWSAKTTSITSTTKNPDGTYPTEEGALTNGSYLLNAAGKPVIKYHLKQRLTILTADNNANTDSDKKASRLQIDGKWVEQFVGVTDSYLNGSAAVSYAPVIFASASSTTPYKSGAGQAYMDYCATGTILWELQNGATGNEVISCFEYIGSKLSTSIEDIKSDVENIIGTTMQGVVASVGVDSTASTVGIGVDSTNKTAPEITFSAGTVGGGADAKLVTGSTVKSYVDTQIGNLSKAGGAIATLDGEIDTLQSTLWGASGSATKPDGGSVMGRVNALESGKLSYQVVDTLPAAANATLNVIYLVPEKQDGEYVGYYAEWLCCMKDGAKHLEQIGTTATDLSGYATVDDHNALANRVTATENAIGDSTKGLIKSVADAQKAVDDLEALVGTTSVESQISNTTLSATNTSGDNNVTVTLGGTVGDPTISVTTTGLATADALAKVKTTADGAVQSIQRTDGAAKTLVDIVVTGGDGTNPTIATDESKLVTKITSIEGSISNINAAIGTGTNGLATRLSAVENKATDNETAITNLTTTVSENKAAATQTQTDLDALEANVAGLVTGVSSVGKSTDSVDNYSLLTVPTTKGDAKIKIDTTALKEAIDAKAATTALTAHTGNGDIHVTAAEKTRWDRAATMSGTAIQGVGSISGTKYIKVTANESTAHKITWTVDESALTNELAAKATTTALSDHTGTTTIHVSSEDRTKWNTAATTANNAAKQTDLTALAGRVTTAEGAITTLTGSGDGSVAKAAADALADAKDYTDDEIAKLTGTGSGSLQSQITTNKNAIDTLKGVSLTKTSTQSAITTATTPTITVKTNGTIGTGLTGLNVEIGDVASAKLLSELTTKVDNHISDAAKLGIIVATAAEDGTPNVTTPSTNKIYLVQGTGAESGAYVEWIYVAVANTNDTQYKWERIGTTAADLTEYVKSSTLSSTSQVGNGITISQSGGNVTGVSVDAGAVASGNTSVVTGGTVYNAIAALSTGEGAIAALDARVDTAEGEIDTLQGLVGNTAVATQITNAINALDSTKSHKVGETEVITVAQENGAIKTVSANLSNTFSATGTSSAATLATDATVKAAYTAAVNDAKSTVEGYNSTGDTVSVTSKTINISDGRETVTANDLWGTKATVTQNTAGESVITITNSLVKNPNNNSAWNTSITKVENNKAYTGTGGTTFYANIQTDALIDGRSMFYQSALQTFYCDLSNLANGSRMFAYCSNLQSFSKNLSNLTNGK